MIARVLPKGRGGKLAGAALALAIVTIGGFEGLRTHAYRDAIGVPTVCFGETRGVRMGDVHTIPECKAMLGVALQDFSAGVDRCLTRPVPDKAYVAFESFAYNVGLGNFCGSTAVKKANAGNLRGACDELLKWDRAGGKRLAGLTRRRQEERKLCLADAA